MNNESIKKSGFVRSQATAPSVDVLNNQGRIPPQAVDLEEVVLGALMLEREAVNAVIDILSPEAFYKEAHQIIFDAIKDLFTKAKPLIFSRLPTI